MDIAEGFSSLGEALAWDAKLAMAEEAIDCLWLQKALYAIAEAAKAPQLSKLTIRRDRSGHGVELCAFMEMPKEGELAEVSALMLAAMVARAGGEFTGPLEAVWGALREVEMWFRERPGMLRGAAALAREGGVGCVEVRRGDGWDKVADAMGAHAAKARMERAQIDVEAGSGGGAGGARRL